jgi:hypothetical protein
MTAEEIKIVRRRAALARLPTATYVRASALRPTSPPHAVPVLNIRSYGQLGRLANNLNQLTKLAHQGRILPALLPNLADLLVEVRRLRRQLVGLHPDPESDPDTDADPYADTDPGTDADPNASADADPNAADPSTAAGREPEPASEPPSESDPTPNPNPTPGHSAGAPAEPRE